jgi:hypothetical protein
VNLNVGLNKLPLKGVNLIVSQNKLLLKGVNLIVSLNMNPTNVQMNPVRAFGNGAALLYLQQQTRAVFYGEDPSASEVISCQPNRKCAVKFYWQYSFAQINLRTSLISTLVLIFMKYNSTFERRVLSGRAIIWELEVLCDKTTAHSSKILFHLQNKGIFDSKQNYCPESISTIK